MIAPRVFRQCSPTGELSDGSVSLAMHALAARSSAAPSLLSLQRRFATSRILRRLFGACNGATGRASLSLLASVFYAVFSASRRPTTCLREGYERFFDRWRPKLLTELNYTEFFSHFLCNYGCAPHACYHYEQTSAARSFTSALILQRVLALAVASASSYRLLSLAALTCVRRQPVVVRATAMGFRCRGGA